MSSYCVIGKSLPHTISPIIHGMLGNADYGVRELASVAELRAFVQSADCDGFNVTIPYKRDIIPMLDGLSESASEIGAVNTVVKENRKYIGYNTDAEGMSFAIKEAGIALYGLNVLILGSGGTCNTAKYVCKAESAARVDVVSRTGELNYENCYELDDVNVVINTTPVGMTPHAYETPLDLSRFARLDGVFDCVYNPLRTLLAQNAKALGIKAATGLRMLAEQARAAHNLFMKAKGGEVANSEKTYEILQNLSKSRQNIVLTGMAGSGKSAVGRALARELNRSFIDTDSEIERRERRSISQIFAQKGEKYFRRLEEEAVERACSLQGAVIATGGGAVLSEKNVFFMRSNGVCVLIERSPKSLATRGRPLSDNAQKAAALYESRKPIYLATADHTVNNDGSLEETVNKITEWWRI